MRRCPLSFKSFYFYFREMEPGLGDSTTVGTMSNVLVSQDVASVQTCGWTLLVHGRLELPRVYDLMYIQHGALKSLYREPSNQVLNHPSLSVLTCLFTCTTVQEGPRLHSDHVFFLHLFIFHCHRWHKRTLWHVEHICTYLLLLALFYFSSIH